jgi:Tetracyclin repressor-like, C-terminal domain
MFAIFANGPLLRVHPPARPTSEPLLGSPWATAPPRRPDRQRLERTDGDPSPADVAYARTEIDAIAQAQKTGDLPEHFHPGFLLGLVLHLATGWVSVSPEFEAAIDVPNAEERARHVEDAIRTLLSPPARA